MEPSFALPLADMAARVAARSATARFRTLQFGRIARGGASSPRRPRLHACSIGDPDHTSSRRRGGPGDPADDRRPAGRQSHDRVQRFLASRSAV